MELILAGLAKEYGQPQIPFSPMAPWRLGGSIFPIPDGLPGTTKAKANVRVLIIFLAG